MFRNTTPQRFTHNAHAGFRLYLTNWFFPNALRSQQCTNMAHRVERGLRLQAALKANKVDIRALLALPVTDSAHPYKSEFPWEKLLQVHNPKGGTSAYGRYYYRKVINFYEWGYWHRYGAGCDDLVCLKAWWGRAARTRAPQDKLIHSDRKVLRVKAFKMHYNNEKKSNWMHPVDNVQWFSPYIVMVADEWEEKWGFFAGTETEF